jgi:uncharacterized protein (TIGR02996 family)
VTDGEALIRSILEAAADDAPRLVYADWLDDRGDPRGELIRIEEEMRSLPAFADRYWELKPRRNELRDLAEPDWLGAFGYGTMARPLFGHGIPGDWKGRWRLIREFVERWRGIPMGDVATQVGEVSPAEARLGRIEPPAVCEWVAFVRDVHQSGRGDRVFRDIPQAAEELGGYAADSLMLQGEGDYHWAVRHADFGLPDPPVYGFVIGYEGDMAQFVPDDRNPIHDSVTAFVLSYVWGMTHGEGGGFGVEVDDPAPLIRQLEATFPVKSRYRHIDIYEADDFFVQLYWNPGRAPGLEVEVARPLPREAVPAFLWEYARSGGRFHGMFIPRDLRRV